MRAAIPAWFPGAAAQLDGWAGLAALANPSPLSQYSCAAIKLLAEGAAHNNECSFCLAVGVGWPAVGAAGDHGDRHCCAPGQGAAVGAAHAADGARANAGRLSTGARR